MKPLILLVDDDPGIRFSFAKYLAKEGYETVAAASLAEAREAVAAQRVDAVLLDLLLPDGNGIDLIADLRADRPDMAIIVISAAADVPIAVEAMRLGADNLLTKPVKMAELSIHLQKSLELEKLRRKDLTRTRLTQRRAPYFGESEAMRQIHDLVRRVGPSDSTDAMKPIEPQSRILP